VFPASWFVTRNAFKRKYPLRVDRLQPVTKWGPLRVPFSSSAGRATRYGQRTRENKGRVEESGGPSDVLHITPIIVNDRDSRHDSCAPLSVFTQPDARMRGTGFCRLQLHGPSPIAWCTSYTRDSAQQRRQFRQGIDP
jgi:hypothetical protein